MDHARKKPLRARQEVVVHSNQKTAPASVIVVGTSHRLQGALKQEGSFHDPGYLKLVGRLISEEAIDFVFEEASECGPTAAQRLATEIFGSTHYFDVDPHPAKRHNFGICKDNGEPFSNYPTGEEYIDEHLKREKFWVERILEQRFKPAIVICGFLHTLSLAFRLRAVGFRVESRTYIPYRKLARGRSG